MSIRSLRSGVTRYAPQLLMILILIQPLMDTLSFWAGKAGISNLPTLALRLAVLGVTVLLGFIASDRKRFYWIAAGVVALIGGGHIFACLQVGYADPFSDLANFIRVIQLPLTAISMISLIRANGDGYDAMMKGMVGSLLLIFVIELLASVTGTEPHTYKDGAGILGWFNNTNSQSAILSMVVPVSVIWLSRKKGWLHPAVWIVLVVSMAAMYLLATRLAYLGAVATCIGLAVCLLIISLKNWKPCLALLAVGVVMVSLIPISPMNTHQDSHESRQDERQGWVEAMIEKELETDPDESKSGTGQGSHGSSKLVTMSEKKRIELLTPVYEYYSPDFVEIFGAEKTIRMYNFTTDIREMTALRPRKIMFAKLLMNESPASAQLFGLELSRFTVGEYVYDVENDFHGIYFLYGWVGLAAMLLFLAYFLWLIAKGLITNFRQVFTADAAAWGIALVMCLIHVYNTAGVLRRPNASFYLSAILAAVYYLVVIRPGKVKK